MKSFGFPYKSIKNTLEQKKLNHINSTYFLLLN